MLLSLEPRGQQSRLMLWCSPLLAAVLTLGCGSLLFIALGHDPLLTLHTLLIAPISDLCGVSELLVKALPILLCALGLAVAYQARIWNIGAEGQLLLGALAGSALAVNIIGLQSRWALVLILLIGTLAGAAWTGLTAWLRTRFNANETLISIMLNYIALNLLLFCVHGPLKDPAGFNFPESAMFGDASRLPLLVEDGRVHAGVYFALLALVAVWVLLAMLAGMLLSSLFALVALVVWVIVKSRVGLIIQAVGENPDAASAMGLPGLGVRTLAVLFGGAMAGLAGAYLSLAYTPMSENLSARRGWIALALVVFASWRVWRLGAYLFGLASILHLVAQGLGLAIPSSLLAMLPYVATIVVLVLLSRDALRTRLYAPMSLGQPWQAGH
ncbi:ABC transporter permease [Pseudomonas sp. MDT1-16]